MRASSFAVRSARRARTRRQLQADLDACNSPTDSAPSSSSRPGASRRQPTDDTHDESVDKLLHDVRTLMRSKASPNNSTESDQDDIRSLRDALKRADDQFRQDVVPTEGSSSSSTAEAAREELGVVESIPPPPKANMAKEDENLLSPCEKPAANKSKKPPRTPQTERLARFRARLEKSRLSPEVGSKPSEKNIDDSDVEANMFDHKSDIEALKKDDPEFYKFLEENDATLLDVDDLTFGGDIGLSDFEKDDDAVDEVDDDSDDSTHDADGTRGNTPKQSDDEKPKSASKSPLLKCHLSTTESIFSGEKSQVHGAASTYQEQKNTDSSSDIDSNKGLNVESDKSNSSDSESSQSDSEDNVTGIDLPESDAINKIKNDLQSGDEASALHKSAGIQASHPYPGNTESSSEQRSALKPDQHHQNAKSSSASEGSSSSSESLDGSNHGANESAASSPSQSSEENNKVVPAHDSVADTAEKIQHARCAKGDKQDVISIPGDLIGSENGAEEDVIFVEGSQDKGENDRAIVVELDDDSHKVKSEMVDKNNVGVNTSSEKEVSKQPSSGLLISDGEVDNSATPVDDLGIQPVEHGSRPDATHTQVALIQGKNQSLKSPKMASKDSGSLLSSTTKIRKRVSSRRSSTLKSGENSKVSDGKAVSSAPRLETEGGLECRDKSITPESVSRVSELADDVLKASSPDSSSYEDRKEFEERIAASAEVGIEEQKAETVTDRTGYSSEEDSDEERLEEAAAREAGIADDSTNAVDDNAKNGSETGLKMNVSLNELEPDSDSDETSESETSDGNAATEMEADGYVSNEDGTANGGGNKDLIHSSEEADHSDDCDVLDENDGKVEGSSDGGSEAASHEDSDTEKIEEQNVFSKEDATQTDGEADLTVDGGLVDLKYLRSLKDLVDSNRAGAKVCKKLLLIFQSGRDVLPKSMTGDGKQNPKTKKDPDGDGDMVDEGSSSGEDEYQKDGTITAGKLKFVSTKAYQQAMNLAIIALQDVLDRLLEKPTGKRATDANMSNWVPSNSGRWGSLQSIFRGFVYNMLSLCNSVVDAPTLRFLLKRLERVAPYTHENENLLKRVLRVVLRIWSSDLQHISQETRLQAYLLLNRLAHVPGNTELVLRFCFNSFVSNIAPVCNPRTLPLIRFAIACIVELYGIDMGASYSTLFSYLREMAVTLRTVLVSKDELEDIEKVHNWKFINELRLWSRVLAKYGEEDELRPLIYPYVQVSLGLMGLHPTPRTFPLRLHIASFLTDVVQETGVFIPVVPNLLLLLRCSELKKYPKHSDVKGLEWRALLRVSDDAVKSKGFLSGLVDGVAFEISRFFAIISKHVSFPELSFVAECALRKAAKNMAIAESKSKLILVATKLKATADEIVKARSKADLAPQGAISERGMLACVPGIDAATKMPIERLFEVELERMQKQNRLRDEVSTRKRPNATLSEEDEDESDSSSVASDDGKQRATKKPKTSSSKKTKSSQRASLPSLHVPDVHDGDEQDHVAKLDLDSDSSGSD